MNAGVSFIDSTISLQNFSSHLSKTVIYFHLILLEFAPGMSNAESRPNESTTYR